ncbi:mitochondrial inner membrane protease subunit 1 [Hetaerina americana]|uniref:mitochondrial inner membrane protease subunit 1 n=1 Tax=Hetaerina americana TaxID=62018 RepID=UPI003A7F4D9B
MVNLKTFSTKFFVLVGCVVKYGCIAHCTLEFIGDFVVCVGPSMEPTIESQNIILTEHITPRLRRIKKGDIVIAKSPNNPRQLICKRVVGLPGDRVRWGMIKSDVVPRGYVWLEGDNNSNSTDSRDYGPVPQGLIRGRALCKVWPPQDMRVFSNSLNDPSGR